MWPPASAQDCHARHRTASSSRNLELGADPKLRAPLPGLDDRLKDPLLVALKVERPLVERACREDP